ncbi:20S proteasome subunit beta 1 [Histomonas meleagridis]|nr:20S proteasome subunit beta 1 [Histomonas meleagridis]
MFGPDSSMTEHTGTTILAIQCTDGVVMAADSRSTMGQYVSSRASNKITPLSPTVYIARTGTTAHTQTLGKYAKYALNIVKMNTERDVNHPVSIAAHHLSRLIQNNKEMLSAGFICAGCDSDGPAVWEISVSGMALKRKFAANGSGSAYITAYCDDNCQEDFTMEQATEFAISAVNNAIVRDGASGSSSMLFKSIQKVQKDYLLCRKTNHLITG